MRRRELAGKVALAYAMFEAEHPAGTSLTPLDRRFAYSAAHPYIDRGEYRPNAGLAFNYARLAVEARHPRHLGRARRDVALGITEGWFSDDPHGPRFPRNADGTERRPSSTAELEAWVCPECGAGARSVESQLGEVMHVADTDTGRAMLRAGLEPQPHDAHRVAVTRNYRLECDNGHRREWVASAR